jgi:hypothetical protein
MNHNRKEQYYTAVVLLLLLPMKLKDLSAQLLSLTPAHQAQAIQLLALSLTNSGMGVEKAPGVVGGDACIERTRIPVCRRVNYRRLGASDA